MADQPSTAELRGRPDATVPVECDLCPRSIATVDDEPKCENVREDFCLSRIVWSYCSGPGRLEP